jgi:predicted nucleic acid-binding protein
LIYLDTSVLVAYYHPEPLSAVAQNILRAQSKPAISPLNEVELMSALARKIREGNLSKADGERIAALFIAHIQQGLYQPIAFTDNHYSQARDWLRSFQTKLRTLDALHLAVAADFDLQIVTADKPLTMAAEQLGVSVQFVSSGED